MAGDLDADGHPRIDPEQQRDVARWRKGQRERLIAQRMVLSAGQREALASAIATQLEVLLTPLTDPIVSVYWPIRAEPDLRSWMRGMHLAGVRFALPVVVAPAMPLEFRAWTPGCAMEPGVWRIPQPAQRQLLVPTLTIAPLVGYDSGCYRLGYGGGFFDRTLAALEPHPLVVGVGHPALELATIYPQPFDVPMDQILTGESPPLVRTRRTGAIAPLNLRESRQA